MRAKVSRVFQTYWMEMVLHLITCTVVISSFQLICKVMISCCSNPDADKSHPKHTAFLRSQAHASCEGDRCDAENSALLTIPRFRMERVERFEQKKKQSEQWYDNNKHGSNLQWSLRAILRRNLWRTLEPNVIFVQTSGSGSEAILWLLNGAGRNNNFKSTLQCSMPLLPLGRDKVLKPATVKSHIIYSW